MLSTLSRPADTPLERARRLADGSGFLPFDQELVVDLFAGGGGASTGIARAYREPDVAVNHDEIAIAVHRANHPATRHYQEDVFEVDPITATGGKPVGLLWASPDCRHHSKAKGAAPRSKRIRGLAWVVVRWALATRPRLIEMENVEEFQDWGPLDNQGQAIRGRKGETFHAFIAAMTTGLPADHPAMAEVIEFLGTDEDTAALVRGLGYTADWRELRACDKGAPTIRKRLLVKLRCDGQAITWAPDTRGPPGHPKVKAGKLAAWRTAAECIDWSIPACGIFATRPEARAWARGHDMPGTPRRPLAEPTLRRLARGLWRHVLTSKRPYIVPAQSTCDEHTGPHATTEGSGPSLVAACLTAFGQNAVGFSPAAPMQTALAGATRYGVVAAYLEQANGGFYDGTGRDLRQPVSTILQTGSHQQLVTAFLVKYYGSHQSGSSPHEPMHTVPTKDRMGLVRCIQVPVGILAPEHRERARQAAHFLHEFLPEHFPVAADMVLMDDYALVDVTLRMLMPAELARAQGFPADYILDRGLFVLPDGNREWRPISKAHQVRLIGNSVCPDMAQAEIAHDLARLIALYQKVA